MPRSTSRQGETLHHVENYAARPKDLQATEWMGRVPGSLSSDQYLTPGHRVSGGTGSTSAYRTLTCGFAFRIIRTAH